MNGQFLKSVIAAYLTVATSLGCVVTGSPGSTASSADDAPPSTSSGDPVPTTGSVRIYVAGESIERRNRFVEAPFTASGALVDRGDLRNDNDEYGWSIPLADRLKLRYPGLSVDFVGADTWLDADDNPYSGSYPSGAPGRTSAISGTDIPSWLESRAAELEGKAHCYDLAFAARGGNDFGNEDDAGYEAALADLVVRLANGSSCRTDPAIYVTAHVPDDQRGGAGPSDAEYVAQQRHRFVERASAAVQSVRDAHPEIRVHFVDLYTPFTENRPTTAFPAETWSTAGIPDFAKITREGDSMHIRRLASIYIGEIAADAVDLAELGIAPK
ncbi:MAG: hypothetical protein U0414_04270 [Polyangiaceae bacterium]